MGISHEVPFPDAGLVVFGLNGVDLSDHFDGIAGCGVDYPFHLLFGLRWRGTVDCRELRVAPGQKNGAGCQNGEEY